jgi:hypothetical protein
LIFLTFGLLGAGVTMQRVISTNCKV